MNTSSGRDAHRRAGPDTVTIAVVTISDTRTRQTDSSGDFLEKAVQEAGHTLSERALVKDDKTQIREILERLLKSEAQVVITSGGTGIAGPRLYRADCRVFHRQTHARFRRIVSGVVVQRSRWRGDAVSSARRVGRRRVAVRVAGVFQRRQDGLGQAAERRTEPPRFRGVSAQVKTGGVRGGLEPLVELINESSIQKFNLEHSKIHSNALCRRDSG